MSCSLKETAVFTVGLITGTGTTLTGKILYGIESKGLNDTYKNFEKPIFQTWGMFLAMMVALPIHWIYQLYGRLQKQSYHTISTTITTNSPSKIEKTEGHSIIPLRTYFILAIPAAFDLLASFFANIGLMYVTVSAFQLLKCTVIVFVAILKVFYLGDKLEPYMWIGISFNILAVLFIGSTSFLEADIQPSNNASPLLGITMIILSCLVQSCQYVLEERLMQDGENTAPPLFIVGMEGVWGMLFTTFIVYPIAYFLPGGDAGSLERFDDAWIMLGNSHLAQGIFTLFILFILFYNIFAVFVTYLLNSIWHAILDNFRPITVWSTDLCLYYLFTNHMFGETLTKYSWLQFIGMLLLLVGTAIYNGTIKLQGYKYITTPENYQRTPTIRVPVNKSSGIITHSPMIMRTALEATELARRTPDQRAKEQILREYMTEYHPMNKTGKDKTQRRNIGERTSYGSLEI